MNLEMYSRNSAQCTGTRQAVATPNEIANYPRQGLLQIISFRVRSCVSRGLRLSARVEADRRDYNQVEEKEKIQ